MDKDFILNAEKKIIVINSFSGVSRVEDVLYIMSCKTLQNDHDYVAYINTKPGELVSMNVTYTNDIYKYKGRKCILIYSKDGVNASIIAASSLDTINDGFVIEYAGKENSSAEDEFKCGFCGNIIKKSELCHDGNIECPYCEFGFTKK